jgi:hypothetical protein
VVYHDGFGGYWEVVEQPARSKSVQHPARLPVNTEPRSADVRLNEAVQKYGQRLAARVNQ